MFIFFVVRAFALYLLRRHALEPNVDGVVLDLATGILGLVLLFDWAFDVLPWIALIYLVALLLRYWSRKGFLNTVEDDAKTVAGRIRTKALVLDRFARRIVRLVPNGFDLIERANVRLVDPFLTWIEEQVDARKNLIKKQK